MPDRRLSRSGATPARSGATPGEGSKGDAHDTRQRDVIEHFGILLARLGGLLSSMIGADATNAVLWSALLATRRDYPVLNNLEVSDVGSHVAPLPMHLSHVDDTELQHSLMAYIDGIVALVADITGEVLVVKITPLVHQFQQRLGG